MAVDVVSTNSPEAEKSRTCFQVCKCLFHQPEDMENQVSSVTGAIHQPPSERTQYRVYRLPIFDEFKRDEETVCSRFQSAVSSVTLTYLEEKTLAQIAAEYAKKPLLVELAISCHISEHALYLAEK